MASTLLVGLLLILHAVVVHGERTECDATFRGSMDECLHLSGVIPNITLSSYCEDKTVIDTRKIRCSNMTRRCGRHYKFSIFNQQLFAITMKTAVKDMIHGCCNDCTDCSIVNKIEDVSRFTAAFDNSPDIIFPIISKASIVKLHDYLFIPTFNVPSSYYFTLRKTTNEIVKEVFMACLTMWPLFLVCVLLAFLSGFIVWVVETKQNESEFQRAFFGGVFDGFWWSFISMTTVGFGDKCPKSYIGRMYAVVWILVGITLCSIFTASLITEIIQAKEVDTEINGKKIGVLKYRLHDISIVSDHGGVLYQTSIYKTMRGINELLILLQNRSIDGFLLDRNTFYHFNLFSKEKKKHKYIADRYRDLNLLKTEKFPMEKLQCGVLVKSKSDYEYFKSFFVDYRIHHEACNSLRMNSKRKVVKKTLDLFTADSNLFEKFLHYSLAILGVLVVFGFCFEVRRYCKVRRNKEISSKGLLSK